MDLLVQQLQSQTRGVQRCADLMRNISNKGTFDLKCIGGVLSEVFVAMVVHLGNGEEETHKPTLHEDNMELRLVEQVVRKIDEVKCVVTDEKESQHANLGQSVATSWILQACFQRYSVFQPPTPCNIHITYDRSTQQHQPNSQAYRGIGTWDQSKEEFDQHACISKQRT